MATCDHCGDDSPVTSVLNHVSFDGDTVSKMVSSYRVCLSCRSDLKNDNSVSW